MKRSPFWRNPFVADPDAETQKRRKRAYGARGAYFESRRDAMVTLYRDGATLEEIGALYGVTRERARQVIAGAAKRGTGLDPIKTVKVCRKASALSVASDELGRRSVEVRALLQQTGYWPAMHRLWEWRKRKAMEIRTGKWSDEELIESLQQLAAKLGHTPSMNEMNAEPNAPTHTSYVHRWGNWAPACAAAGLKPSRRGAHGHKNRDPETGLKSHCKRGHPLIPENLYTYMDKSRRERRVCKACSKLRKAEERQELIDAGKLTPHQPRNIRLFMPELVEIRNSLAA